MRIKDSEIRKVADEIAPYAREIIKENGTITSEAIIRLAKEHASHRIVSERSVGMVSKRLCEIC